MSTRSIVIGLAVAGIGIGVGGAAALRVSDRVEAAGEGSAPAASRNEERVEARGPSRADERPPVTIDCGAPAGIVARVGDRDIPTADLCATIAGLSGEPDEGRVLRDGPTVLQQLVESELVAQALARSGQRVSEEEVSATLGPDLASAPPAMIRARARAHLERARLVGALGEEAIDDDAVRAAYAAEPERWATPARARVSGWLARVGARTPRDEEARLRGELAALAERRDPSADPPEGIVALPALDIETLGLEPELEAVVFSRTFSPPAIARTRAGWVLVTAREITPAAPRPFEDAAADVRRALASRRRADRERALMAELSAGTPVQTFARWR